MPRLTGRVCGSPSRGRPGCGETVSQAAESEPEDDEDEPDDEEPVDDVDAVLVLVLDVLSALVDLSEDFDFSAGVLLVVVLRLSLR